jgi:hypothetical protein
MGADQMQAHVNVKQHHRNARDDAFSKKPDSRADERGWNDIFNKPGGPVENIKAEPEPFRKNGNRKNPKNYFFFGRKNFSEVR